MHIIIVCFTIWVFIEGTRPLSSLLKGIEPLKIIIYMGWWWGGVNMTQIQSYGIDLRRLSRLFLYLRVLLRISIYAGF